VTLTDLSIALPLLILAIGAILTLVHGAVTKNHAAGAVLATAAAIVAGLWALRAPAAVSAPALGLAAGGLARLFTAYFAFMAAAVLVLSRRVAVYRGIEGEEYPSTILFAAFGMVALASATNMLIIFLGFEAMTFGFYLLAAIDRERTVSSEAGLKYLLMGVVSAAFLAFGIALLYFSAGTLALGELVRRTLGTAADPVALAGWSCFLVGVFFKLSLVPAHLWTPDVYQTAPAPVVAFLSAGSKAAAVLLLLLLWSNAASLAALRLPLLAVAVLSMVVGNLAALRQNNIRRLLAYSSIAQMGYVVVALIGHKGGGLPAAAFYAIAYGIISLAAFGAVGVLEEHGCDATLDDYRGRGFSHPLAAGVLATAMFALAGIPPTVGFTGKFLIFAAAIRAGEYLLAVIGILTAGVSIYYYLRVVAALYLQPAAGESKERLGALPVTVLALSAALIVLMGLFPSRLLDFLNIQLP
jgi:NADH-quinone oxidoreductase subunit N